MKIISILFLLLIIPSTVFAKIGKVYFCEMDTFVNTYASEVTEYKLEKFKFKRSEKGLIFKSEKGIFQNFKLTVNHFDDGELYFSYGNRDGNIVFNFLVDKFYFSHATHVQITSSTGTCSTP